jgi:hypothetical protein
VVIDTLDGRYRGWCVDEGLKPLAKTLFGRDLRAVLPRLHDERPHGQQRQYVGIGLQPSQWDHSTRARNALSRFEWFNERMLARAWRSTVKQGPPV